MIDRHLGYLITEMRERMALLADALASDKVSSYDEYRYTCGQIRGLESACFVIETLKQRLENSDNE
jgi:hypothetical protein